MMATNVGKSFLYRVFGAGGIPNDLRRELEREGMSLSDEGLRMAVYYRRYRSPTMMATGRKGIPGYIAITRKRLVVKGYGMEVSSIPFEHPKAHTLDYGLHRSDCIRVAFEASDFYSDRRGKIEHRLTTPLTSRFVTALDAQLGRS